MYQDMNDDNDNDERSPNFYEANKKLVWVLVGLIIIVIIAFIFTRSGGSNNNTNDDEPEFEITEKDVSVEKDKSKQVSATIKNYPNAEIIWQSEDTEIAIVDQKTGLLTGKNLGNTKLKLTYIHKGKDPMYESINVTVFEGNPDSELISASFPEGDLMMSIGSTYDLNDKLITTPDDGYIEKKEFTSSDPSIAQIDEEGVVQARSSGETTITVKINNIIEANIKVYVLNELITSSIVVNPAEISLGGSLLKVKLGEIKKLEYTVAPITASTNGLKWESSDENTVIVSSEGEISALAEGTATIVVKAINGVEGKILVEVEKEIIEVQSVSYSQSSISLQVGSTYNFIPEILPSNASNKSLTFSSSAPTIATAVGDYEGVSATIYAYAQGTAVITFKSANGKTGKVTVNVSAASSGGGSGSGGSTGGGTTSRGYALKSGSGRVNNTLNSAKSNPAYQKSDWITLSNTAGMHLRYCQYMNGNPPCDVASGTPVDGKTQVTINVNGIGIHVLLVKEDSKNKINYHYLDLRGEKKSSTTTSSSSTSTNQQSNTQSQNEISDGKDKEKNK